MIVGTRVDHETLNRQTVRAKEVREGVRLSQEEHFNLFEMTPTTALDRYFNQIDSGTIKSQLVSTNDDNID